MLLAVACSVAWQPTAPLHRALAPARASAPRLAVDTGVGKDASLEAEFESVKAASKVAADLAPSLEEMTTPARRRKRDAIYGAWRRAKSLVGLKKELDAAVLAQLSNDSDENVTEISVGLRSLIQLLGSPSTQAQAHAAAVLADLTRNSADNRADVAREGGIEPLVRLLTDGEVLPQCDARAEAAGALWSLAEGSHETKAAIADAEERWLELEMKREELESG